MAKKIVSVKAELNVLRGLCNKDKRICGTLLSLVDDSYFYHKTSKAVYKYIKQSIEKTGEAPSYEVLLEDPELSDDCKEYIEQSVDSVKTVEDAHKAINILNTYRQIRGLYCLAQDISLSLESEDDFNLDRLLDKTASDISSIRSTKSTKDSFLTFGKGNNSKDFVHDLLYSDHTDALIPTGYNVFDSVSGGLPRQGLVTIGANSGMGKSLLAGDLAVKMASKGYRVIIVPLEMSKAEMTSRIIANVTDTELSKIIQNKLTEQEKSLVYKRYMRWVRGCAKLGGKLTIFKPEGDLDIGEIYASVATYNPDVCIVDYISLLKGLDGDDQWLRLGAIARQAKTNAETEHRVNILLCQVNDDGKIRYARSISEHCVVGSTLIETDKGKIRIDSLLPEIPSPDCEPFSKTVRNVKARIKGKFRNISDIHYNGVRTVYKMVLKNDYKITCTASHKFLAKGKKGLEWIALGDLKVGDFITVANGSLVEIKSITEVGQHQVFDITVPKVNAYEANGIVCHNSNVSWIWTGNQETKDSGIMKIEQPKSRNALAFPFLLHFDYSKMRVKDVPQDMLDETEVATPKKKQKPEKNLASDI